MCAPTEKLSPPPSVPGLGSAPARVGSSVSFTSISSIGTAAVTDESVSTTKSHSRQLNRVLSLFASIALVRMLFVCHGINSAVPYMGDNSVYVPGGGFSGFWYTLGRLKGIEQPQDHEYYCYSAGCLGIVATIQNRTIGEVYGMASDAQKRWRSGDLDRYNVVTDFVDNLLFDKSTQQARDSVTEMLPKIHVITTIKHEKAGFSSSIRTPKDLYELRTMLLQTTWIPFAVGNGLWHHSHMDGAFTMFNHPKCARDVGFGLDFEILLNAVNINLSYEKAMALWKRGLEQSQE